MRWSSVAPCRLRKVSNRQRSALLRPSPRGQNLRLPNRCWLRQMKRRRSSSTNICCQKSPASAGKCRGHFAPFLSWPNVPAIRVSRAVRLKSHFRLGKWMMRAKQPFYGLSLSPVRPLRGRYWDVWQEMIWKRVKLRLVAGWLRQARPPSCFCKHLLSSPALRTKQKILPLSASWQSRIPVFLRRIMLWRNPRCLLERMLPRW